MIGKILLKHNFCLISRYSIFYTIKNVSLFLKDIRNNDLSILLLWFLQTEIIIYEVSLLPEKSTSERPAKHTQVSESIMVLDGFFSHLGKNSQANESGYGMMASDIAMRTGS